MVSFLDGVYISAKNRMIKGVERFKSEELGVSSIVATVLLILIVVLLAAMFWNSISEWIGQLWNKITGGANDLQNTDPSKKLGG